MISTEFANGECRASDPPSVRGQLDGSHPNSGCGPSFLGNLIVERQKESASHCRLQSGVINCLRQAAGGIVSKAEIFEWIYANDPDGGPESDRIIDVAVCWLRRKGFPIETYKGRGYRYRWTMWECAP